MLAVIQKILAWRFFSRREEPSGAVDIIKWWELRRIPYNLIVGATGILTLLVTVAIEPPDPPLFLIFWVFAYGVGANICFTGGWIVEIAGRKERRGRAGAFAEKAFALGLLFSVLLTLVPAVLITAVFGLQLLFSR